MTHEQIRKKIAELEAKRAELENKLAEPEVVKEKSYRAKVTERKKELIETYFHTSFHRRVFMNMVNAAAKYILDEEKEVEPEYNREDCTTKSGSWSYAKARLFNIEQNEEQYFYIYETFCRHIAEAVAESKEWRKED